MVQTYNSSRRALARRGNENFKYVSRRERKRICISVGVCVHKSSNVCVCIEDPKSKTLSFFQMLFPYFIMNAFSPLLISHSFISLTSSTTFAFCLLSQRHFVQCFSFLLGFCFFITIPHQYPYDHLCVFVFMYTIFCQYFIFFFGFYFSGK